MDKSHKRLIVTIAFVIIAATIYILRLSTSLFADNLFLTTLLHDDNSLNAQYLSADFQQYVTENCPDGKASTCIKSLISQDWGELKTVKFGVGSANSELYYSFWSNGQTIVIVLLTGEENGKQVITGWRGFVPSEGENHDAELLHGQRHDNEFQPPI